jgi:hypothetical protein
MHTLLLLTSGLVVGLWVLAACFAMDVIRHIERRRRVPMGGLHLMAPSAWQSVAA